MGQRSYLCPGTASYPAHTFSYFHHPSIEQDPVPRFCPTCGCDGEAVDTPFEREVTAPHISNAKALSPDMVYRNMEGQAEERIQMAAELTGQPVGDFKDMKITDLKDNLKAGEIAAVAMPQNDVTMRMDQMAQRGIPVGFVGNGGQGFAQAAHTGPHPHAGLGAAVQVQQHFQHNVTSIMRNGETGRY